MRSWIALGLAVGLFGGMCALAGNSYAGLTEKEIASLGGPVLTPIGAERAGNAAGTIPEWKGGVTAPPAGWKPGDKRIDLFKDDAPLLTIDASNLEQHKARLTVGQAELLRSYEGYTMNVYPTRRSCAFPDEDYARAKDNARVAAVDDQCFVLAGLGTTLFPIPKNGCEAMQNGKLAVFNGLVGYERMESTLVPTKTGSFVPFRRRQVFFFKNRSEGMKSFEDLKGVWTYSHSETVAPPKQAGEITLVHALADGHLNAWTYNPGQRRVRRAPNFEYDNPAPGWQGLATVDQINGFTGAADRYEWKIVGKKEIYIPYNNHKFFDSSVSYKDMIGPRFPRRDLIRYELHRVWVVEGNVRADRRHVIAKRVLYLDEDSWLIVAVDAYDTRGNLWRVQEALPQVLYEAPSCVSNGTIYYDLVAGRYLVSPVFNEEKEADYLAGRTGKVTEAGFSPDDIRRAGRR